MLPKIVQAIGAANSGHSCSLEISVRLTLELAGLLLHQLIV